MKKLLLLFFCVFLFSKTKAQVVFCPAGAEWHYLFSEAYPNNGSVNETIKYTGDSIEGPDTLKILFHQRFYILKNGSAIGKTLIKQKGDTVFMRNRETNNQWQILYNFAALPGQSWTNTFGGIANPVNYTTTVAGVSTKTFSNKAIKEIYVNYQGVSAGYTYTHSGTISEYYGSNVFLFCYISRRVSDGDALYDFLCYADNITGSHLFSDKTCDFANPTGITEKIKNDKAYSVHPNPSGNFLTIGFKNTSLSSNLRIEVLNTEGEKVITQDLECTLLNIQNLNAGVYFLRIFENNTLVFTHKWIKQ